MREGGTTLDINDLRRQREALKVEARAVLEKSTVTDEEMASAEAKLADADKLDKRIVALEKSMVGSDTPPLETPEQRANHGKPFASLGEMLHAVRCAADPLSPQIDRRLYAIKAQLGLNEGIPSEGGFLVQTDHVAELLKRTYELGALASRVRKIPVSGNANGLTINAINETSRVTGSRWGGIQGYWLHEAGTKTPSMPDFRQMELKLKKLIGLCYATDELLQDTSALESIITQGFSEEFAWLIDNAIYRGPGGGQPVGIIGHPATVVVNGEPGQLAGTILFENIVNMWARAWGRGRSNSVWVINQDIEPQLFTMSLAVGVGGVPVYLPAGGASASPYGTLFGRPVIPIEHASTLGTVGDIALVDLSQYLMIDKGGMQSAQSIHVQFTTDQSAFRFVYRVDGQPTWNAALTPANGANALSPFVVLATR
jgi:HK97 family phage major capsid protein